MDHDDHVRLIRAGVEGAGRRWLELGAGRGAFTLALADLLGQGGEIVAIDRDAGDLRQLASTMAARFPTTRLRTVAADFTAPISTDGGAIRRPARGERAPLRPRPRCRDRPAPANAPTRGPGHRRRVRQRQRQPLGPYPFSFGQWEVTASDAGLVNTRLIGRVPSRFLGAIYAAASEVPAAAVPTKMRWVRPGHGDRGSSPSDSVVEHAARVRPPRCGTLALGTPSVIGRPTDGHWDAMPKRGGGVRGLNRLEARATLPRLTARTERSSAPNGHGASAGRCEPRGTGGANVTREPCGRRPIARREGAGTGRPR